jgi:hypothetical protein
MRAILTVPSQNNSYFNNVYHRPIEDVDSFLFPAWDTDYAIDLPTNKDMAYPARERKNALDAFLRTYFNASKGYRKWAFQWLATS